ncbi:GFA family protein [Aliikangiella marina]|uniref:GFA family protein n=1 Tax=Aliikangiella marina TaxID=1712262 RepID=A0A545T8U2_9GAMM|nr:GFA family protein [Aliikangiella marina]TQV73643.1 GFA family protein [Aliikangiella marina]
MSQSILLEGGCLCGYIRYRATALPFATEYCHCRMCQKTSGAPATTWMDFKVDQLKWLSQRPTEFESSKFVRRGFCPQCGSSISFRDVRHADYLTVTINSLDSPQLIEPTRHIYTEDQMSWLTISDGHPRFKKGPHQNEE